MQALFDSVRAASGARVWSRGVELARAEAVSAERESDAEVVLRIAARGVLVAPSVRLDLAAEAWECDCPSPDDPCEHVAAAVIALRQARQQGRTLPALHAAAGRIAYRFVRAPRGLEFWRAVLVGTREEPLRASLAALAAGARAGPAFAANDVDLRVDELLDTRLEGLLPRDLLARLLGLLSACDEVRLDGEPVSTSGEPLLPLLVVEDRGEGFALALGRDPERVEVFANGAALRAGVLQPLGDPRLSLREREELSRGRWFGPGEVGLLVAEVLPSLASRLRVEVRSARLPRAESARPRLVVSSERAGDVLRLRAELVYGDPPCARVEEGRLVHLGGPLPLRDRRAEERLLVRLRRELELAPGETRELAPEAAIALRPRLERLADLLRGRAHEEFFAAGDLEPVVVLHGERFELGFQTRAGQRVAAERALEAWEERGSLVPLAEGGFARLPAAWLARFGPLVADLLAARDAQGGVPVWALPDLARLAEGLGEPAPAGFERLRALVEDFAGLPAPVLPQDLRARLRPYQLAGVAWLQFTREAGLGALLADDMGLGKTLQALCALRGRTLVVAPTSVVFGWAEQLRRFRPALRVNLYHGARRALDRAADVTLTTYALLRLDQAELAAERWGTVVLDEAQAIKNPDSQVARAAFSLAAEFRMTLTGTPVENRLEELWSQMHFLNPGLLGSREQFRRRYARAIAAGESGAAARLRERLRPFLLRRRKSEVAPELPPRTESILYCELAEAERAVYDAVRAAARAEVVEKLRAGGSVLEALEALLRLRQAACHPGLVPGQHAESSSKIESLLEALDEAASEGHKSLVFSQWTSLLDRVEPHLRAGQLDFIRLDGSTVDRAGVVERFQSEAGPPVMLISLRAGGTGLNLTAADCVFLLDPWWNPAVEDQAADRAHRIGQTRPVFVYRLVARDTVEERILELQEHKRALAEAALAGAERAASITRDELLALLE